MVYLGMGEKGQIAKQKKAVIVDVAKWEGIVIEAAGNLYPGLS